MIEPTVGRVILIRRLGSTNTQPECGLITYVHTNRMINVVGFDANGNQFQRTSIVLLQDDDAKPDDRDFTCWMPYQKGQAAKTEALEKAAQDRNQQ